MSFAEDIRGTLMSCRAIPGQYGVRPHSVTIVRVSFSGDHTGDGAVYDRETPITEGDGQSPKVRWLNQEELALASLPNGSCTIGPITPVLGLDLSNLAGVIQGSTVALRIMGPQHPQGAMYRITQVNAEKGLHYTLVAKPVVEVTMIP